jgi:hypothetical protein
VILYSVVPLLWPQSRISSCVRLFIAVCSPICGSSAVTSGTVYLFSGYVPIKSLYTFWQSDKTSYCFRHSSC